MRHKPNSQAKAAFDLARMTHGAPLLAAATVPWSEVQLAILKEMETLSRDWFDLRRAAVQSIGSTARAIAQEGADTQSVVRGMTGCAAEMCGSTATGLRQGFESWLRCYGIVASGVFKTSVVATRAAQVIIPEEAGNHATPV